MRTTTTVALSGLCILLAGTPVLPKEAEPHDAAFWRGIIAADYAVPVGESATSLILELSELLGSTDPELRDTFGYGIPARWIYFRGILSPEQLREITALWTGNLRRGVGENGTDTILLRSFSALDLSILAAQDLKEPFLGRRGFEELLSAALIYLEQEKDLRGYVAGKGWCHAVAHTADLLKFLGRSELLSRSQQHLILEGIREKLSVGLVYTWGEDERLARAVLSVVDREDLDNEGFETWLQELGSLSAGLWEGELEPDRFMAVQNAKNLLRSLAVILAADAEPSPGRQQARRQILRTLASL